MTPDNSEFDKSVFSLVSTEDRFQYSDGDFKKKRIHEVDMAKVFKIEAIPVVVIDEIGGRERGGWSGVVEGRSGQASGQTERHHWHRIYPYRLRWPEDY